MINSVRTRRRHSVTPSDNSQHNWKKQHPHWPIKSLARYGLTPQGFGITRRTRSSPTTGRSHLLKIWVVQIHKSPYYKMVTVSIDRWTGTASSANQREPKTRVGYHKNSLPKFWRAQSPVMPTETKTASRFPNLNSKSHNPRF